MNFVLRVCQHIIELFESFQEWKQSSSSSSSVFRLWETTTFYILINLQRILQIMQKWKTFLIAILKQTPQEWCSGLGLGRIPQPKPNSPQTVLTPTYKPDLSNTNPLSFQQPNKQTDTGDDTTSAAALTNTELVLHATAEVSTANLQ